MAAFTEMTGDSDGGDLDPKAVGDRLAEDLAKLDPLVASEWGLRSTGLPTFDPEWWTSRRELFAAVATATSGVRGVAAAVLAERAAVEIDWIDSHEAYCELQAAMDSPLFRIRYAFDDMPTSTVDDWESVAERLEAVPSALAGYRRSLEAGRRSGPHGTVRQVLASASAVEGWVDAPGDSVFDHAIGNSAEVAPATLVVRLEVAATAAAQAYSGIAAYLREAYVNDAREEDAVGTERFALWSRRYAGTVIGADDYTWAIDQLAEVNHDQTRLLGEVSGAEPGLMIEGEEAHVNWVRELISLAAGRLAAARVLDEHDWPTVAVRPMETSVGQQAYYSPALEDGTRPATVWIAGGDGPHDVEYEKTVIFHESIPGHHVEAALQRSSPDLSRFQRLMYLPGHSEGWGLYSERLAEESGLVDTPQARLGCRGSQALRLASLIIDVGLHTRLVPPASLRNVTGDEWTVEGAVAFVAAQGLDRDVASWWLTNMIGRPGHRASYSAGERVWLGLRRSLSATPPLGDFHSRLLKAGPMGLELLRRLG